MPQPAQLDIIEATYEVAQDRYITPQELNWYMQTLLVAAVMMVLSSIFWEELTESYEESMKEVGL